MLYTIFRLEKVYKPTTSFTQIEVREYINSLKDFEFFETGAEIHGGFVLDYGWAERANPMLFSVSFLFEKNNLDCIRIKPTFRVYMFLIGIPLMIIGLFIETIIKDEFTNPIAFSIVLLGILAIFFLILYFTRLKIKSIRKKIQLG